MNRIISHLLLITALLCGAQEVRAEIILVENTANAGAGSLRDAIGSASFSANDTVLINVKGTIELTSPIPIHNFTALTIIGPYPKHSRVTAVGGWSGAYFDIVNSGNVRITGLGFSGGTNNTRHLNISGGTGPISFTMCAFEGSNLIGANGGSVLLGTGSETSFQQCSFIDNSANSGGAIRVSSNAILFVENCTFANNTAIVNGGALNLAGSTQSTLNYSTFRNNSAGSNGQAIRASGGTDVTLENLAIAENGSGLQVQLNGGITNNGGNRFLLNPFPILEDAGVSPAGAGDAAFAVAILGLKGTLVENGFGLKYYPIIDGSSFLINPTFTSVGTPLVDCKGAPRNLFGGGANAYPDAGASEYTSLRVTNISGDKSVPNSFLWAIDPAQQEDVVSYVEFDIAGSDHNILFEEEGEVEDEQYIIDGFSQNGSAIPGPHEIGFIGLTEADIQINFIDGDGNDEGIIFNAGAEGSTIQGVSIQEFDRYGLETNVDNIKIFGCEIGFDATNSFGKGNRRVGLNVDSGNNTIGGWEHWMRNVISGNGFAGLERMNVYFKSGNNNIFLGNIVGGSPNGMGSLGGTETRYGLFNNTRFHTIGSSRVNSGNIFIDNDYGIYFEPGGDSTLIQGNKIGIGWDGLTALGNTEAGIYLRGSDVNLIGGKSLSQGNIIAHNQTGVALVFGTTSAIENTIIGNLIYSNDGQGIDFDNNNAVAANDGLIDLTEPNIGLDHPLLNFSTNCSGSNTETNYTLSVPTGDYRVEFFSTTSPDPTNGEGEFFRGFQVVTVTTNPQTFTYTHSEMIPEETLTATVTSESSGNTSEFGSNVIITGAAGDPTITYDDICFGDTAIPNTFDIGGTFRFATPIPPEATIDPDTGEITGTLEGSTYTVIYNFPGCSTEDTTTFEVINVDASFVFDDFCPGTTGTATAIALAGEFDIISPIDGASINDAGELTGGIEGTTYTIRHTVDLLGCADTSFETVQVIATDATFIFDDFCGGAPSPAPTAATAGGTYSLDGAIPVGASINGTTGVITGADEGDTFTVRYVVGPCAKVETVVVNVVTTDEAFIFNDFCPLGPSLPTSVNTAGGTFSFGTPPGGLTSIDPSTGEILMGVESETYEVVYTVGVCSEFSTQNPTMIEVQENFTFADFCIVADTSGNGPIADNLDSSNFYLLEPSFGSSINAATGIIYDVDPSATYTVIDSATNGICWQTDTVIVSPIFVDAVFTMEDFCAYDTGFAVFNTPGIEGNMSFFIDPLDAPILEFDSLLYNTIPGNSYYLKFVAEVGVCKDSTNLTVSIFDPNSDFSMDDFCPGEDSSPAYEYILGGTFNFADPVPAYGVSIDASTGVISGGLEDSLYTVQYIIESGGCFDTTLVELYVQLVPEEFSIEDFCWQDNSEDPSFIEEGEWSFGSPGPAIDDDVILGVDGVITNATEGVTYEIVHELTVAGCTQSDSIEVLAFGVDESFIMEDFCATEVGPPATSVATAGGEFVFGAPLEIGDIATIDPDNGAIINGIEGNEYVIWYNVDPAEGPCTETGIDTVLILGVDQSFVFDDFCAEFAGNVTSVSTTGGNFSFETIPSGSTTIDEDSGTITEAEPGTTYSVIYTVGTCAETDTVMVTALASDVANFITTDYCANTPQPVDNIGTPDGIFTFNPVPIDDAIINPTTGEITNTAGGTYTIQYITPASGSTCQDTLLVPIEIFEIPEIFSINSPDLYCPDETITVLDASVDLITTQVYWYEESTGNPIADSSTTYLPNELVVGFNSFFAQPKSEEGCLGNFQEFIIKLSDTSNMQAISDFQICLGSSAQLEASGGVSYSWQTTAVIDDNTSPNPTAFSLMAQEYLVTITNNDNCEVIDTLGVTFKPINECNLNVYNAFSPNNDGTNDFWYIDNLINYMPNSVYIYNRWGDEVYVAQNYDNINVFWDGTDKSGNPLPPGTYFYVVITEYEIENQAAWVQLVR